MDVLEKIIVGLGIVLIIVIAIGLFLPSITGTGSSINSNSMIIKAQHNFANKEINAIAQSSPIQINPANTMFFGSFKNISQRLCGQLQANFVDNLSVYEIEYNGIYFPISATIGDILQNSVSTNTNLIGEKVYLSFIITKNSSSAPYIINKIYTKGNMFYWVLGQDTGISNSSAVLWTKNSTTLENSASQLNGIEFLNGTPIISPKNPGIDNGNFIVPNC